MKRLRFMLLMLALLLSVGMRGQYNPTNPAEPGGFTLALRSVPADVGSFNMSTATTHYAGETVDVRAYNNGNYKFVRWEDTKGNELSASSHFSYTMAARNTVLVARYEYDPSNPSEPSEPQAYSRVYVESNPAEGGSFNITSGNKYAVGSSVDIRAYNNSNFIFKNWTEDGEVISTSSSFRYVVKNSSSKLVANFEYSPSNPSEPPVARLSHKLTLQCNPSGGGSFNISSGSEHVAGSAVSLYAYNNTYYSFKNWTQDGEIVSTSRSFTYTMPDKDVTLVANYDYDYNPQNPGEPSAPSGSNHLYGVRMNVIAGQSVSYPVYMENTTDVTGYSIDVQFPAGFTVDAHNSSLTMRASGHVLEVQSLGDNAFRFFVRGTETFKGVNGKVLEVPVNVPDTVTVGNSFDVKLAKGVIFKADGSQTPVTVRSGSLKVQLSPDELPDSPDFVVADIHTTATEAMPGDTIHVAWKIRNAGNLPATGGWSERVSLVSESGKKITLGTFYYETDELVIDGTVSREADITLSSLLGIEGKVKVSVTVIPYSYSGEAMEFQRNNTSETSAYVLTVGKQLYLTLPETALTEGDATTVRCQLSRSGNWTETETFKLAKVKGDSRLELPATVTIPRDQSGVYFYLNIVDNDVLDEDDIFEISVSGNGYDEVVGVITVEDNEYPQLTVTSSKNDVTEGETFNLTINLQRASETPVDVAITTDFPKRFSFPSSVTIPAGETEVTVEVMAVENDNVEIQESVAFKVSADKYMAGECIILLDDNDLPAIDLELTPMTVSEAAGPAAIIATLRRTTNKDKKVTILLSDDSAGDIYYSRKNIVFDSGVDEVQFSLGIVDNAIVDGDRKVNITAAVYVSSCSCSALGSSTGSVTKTIEIIDDDGPSLGVTSSKSTLLEGGDVVLTITSNTKTDTALEVSISSDNDDCLSYEHTVTIPAGSKSVDVVVKALPNESSGDSKTIVFSIESAGFSKGTCWVMLTDQTLPDVRISEISVSPVEVEVGGGADVTLTLENVGAAELPDATKVEIYVSNSSTPFATLHTQQVLVAGGRIEMDRKITLPSAIGTYDVYAVVNGDKSVKELLYANNTSEHIKVKTIAPFSATVSTDKSVYSQGEEMLITGHIAGNATAETAVEVYIINEGLRQTLTAQTDAGGNFSVSYKPYLSQMGHFSIGACYPGENKKEEMASADIYGFRRVSSSVITCEAIVGERYDRNVSFVNPGVLPLTAVKATVLSKPEHCTVDIVCPERIDGGKRIDMQCSILSETASSGSDWEEIRIMVETAEGPSVETTLFYYCRNAKGQLQTNVSRINTTMVKGASRDYPITITNVGKGATGKITLALPDWMSAATPLEMASLAYGESVTAILRFTPTDDMQLNVPVTGTIGINCENGNGVALNYSIEPVSELTGTLVVDVCDEYTYYTPEAPHVSGAQVLVKHPTTGAVIAKGLTDSNGLYSVSLPEGYYGISVTADNHDSYKNNILVDPGTVTKEVVNLSFRAITVDWKVEETEVEDEYSIETTVKYETNVPMPVVELSVPSKIAADELQPNESLIFYATLTNKGLITAQDVELTLPSGFKRLAFEALSYNEGTFNLAPQQSVVIPVKVTNITGSSASTVRKAKNIDDDPCAGQVGTLYFWDCGNDRKWHRYDVALQLGSCNSKDPSTWDNQGNGGYGGGGYGGGGGSITRPTTGPNVGGGGSNYGSSTNNNTVNREDKGCEPCQNRFLYKMTRCVVNRIPVLSDVIGIIGWQWVPEYVGDKGVNMLKEGDKIGKFLKPIYGVVKKIKKYVDIYGDCIVPLFEDCDPGDFKSKARNGIKRSSQENPSYVKEYQEKLRITTNLIEAQINKITEIYGSKDWIEVDEEELSDFWDAFTAWNTGTINKEEFKAHKPSSMSENSFVTFVARWENMLNDADTDDKVNVKAYEEYERFAYESYSIMNEDGRLNDYYVDAENEVMERLTDASNSVCATISLQFSQTMTMTRQAFRGTLTVFNGNEENAMENVRLNLEVRDDAGILATSHEFQINMESLDGFTGDMDMTSGWALAANETGTATIVFIPTKYAALEAGRDYSFGGSLTYVDPFTGLEVTRDLFPVTLTVKPSPNIDLTYFMQRDIYGDNPLTPDVIEPCEPAEFALLINNKGYGDATNVRMVTEQPKIVDNEKGLLVDFKLVSSQLNGEAKTLALGERVTTDFGTIPAQSTMYAQWWIESSLLGHFTEYDVEATHVTSYGNEDLSLLDNVTIHELVHGFTVNTASKPVTRGFLVNDIVDAEDMPDMVYFSDGTTEKSVAKASSVEMTRISETEYTVTVTSSEAGWNYGSATDLTEGRQKLVSVVRQSDGAEMPVDNFWLTSCTLRDGKEPVDECLVHSVAEVTGQETFVLTFEPSPETELAVECFTGVPDSKEPLTEQQKSVGVKFNKAIVETTFTSLDIDLKCQGEAVDVSEIVITKVSDTEFTIGLDKVTLRNGYYVLTVKTAGITDHEGFTGTTGSSASWTQFADGNVVLTVGASPKEGGTVSPETGRVAYGTTVILKASPAAGYDFEGWQHGEDIVSENSSFDYTVKADESFVALFAIKHFNVKISCDDECGKVDAASGIYDYGTVLSLNVTAYDGYRFDGWLVDGKIVSAATSYEAVVTGDATITATFSKVTSGGDVEDIMGDVNEDGRLTVVDIVMLSKYISDGNGSLIQILKADLTGDGRITVADVVELARRIANQ